MEYLKKFTKDGRAFIGTFPILTKPVVCPVSILGNVVIPPREICNCFDAGYYQKPQNEDVFYSGYVILVRYSNTLGPCPGGHSCDRAIFKLTANGVVIGSVNLNNGNDGGDRTNPPITITKQVAETIFLADPRNQLDLALVCDLPDNIGCHTSVSWVTVYNESDPFTSIYDGCPVDNFVTLYPSSIIVSSIEFDYHCINGTILKCYRDPIRGCMNKYSLNYNPLAESSDGSCGASLLVSLYFANKISTIFYADDGLVDTVGNLYNDNTIYGGMGSDDGVLYNPTHSYTDSPIQSIFYADDGRILVKSHIYTDSGIVGILVSSDGQVNPIKYIYSNDKIQSIFSFNNGTPITMSYLYPSDKIYGITLSDTGVITFSTHLVSVDSMSGTFVADDGSF